MRDRFFYTYNTPYGPVTIGCVGPVITDLRLGAVDLVGVREPTEMLNACATELLEYFSGKRSVFDFAMDPVGTPFQKEVWDAIGHIPYGHTTTSADIAGLLGKPESFRAVGSAVRENPIAVIIPAHRVVLSSGYVDKRDASARLRAAFRELEQKYSV